MEENKCTHIGFIEKFPTYYKCSNCGKIVKIYLPITIEGVWADGEEPIDVKEQLKFDNLYYIQKNKKKK